MSEPIRIRVESALIFSREAIVLVVNSLRSAINVNSAAQQVVESLPETPYAARELKVITVDSIVSELQTPNPTFESKASYFDLFSHRFSPFSVEPLEITIWRRGDNTIDVVLSVSERVKYQEVEGSEQRHCMEIAWMAELQRRGKISLEEPWSFERPQLGDMDEKDYWEWSHKYDDLEETPSVWPQNRQCLLNIIEHLKQALPVKAIDLDPRLLEEPTNP